MDALRRWWTARDRVLVMGVLNVTPDSFYDGGRWIEPDRAGRHALEMVAEGADLIDIGGESSRPGSRPVSAEEERGRILPVIEWLADRGDVLISVDTTKAAVADAALAAGATVINDISALRFDPEMASVVAEREAAIILMHMRGTPETMQDDPIYDDPVREVRSFLEERIEVARGAGIPAERILIDPGIGFGKRLRDNIALLAGLSALRTLNAPVMVGLSRKSFLGAILDVPAADRLIGTVAANAMAIAHGAELIRVHDVREGRWTADVAYRLRSSAGRP
jgi:dihydropteroate synthase